MPHKLDRNINAPTGATPYPLDTGRTHRHKKSKRNLPPLDQSSNAYIEGPTPKTSSPKRGEGHTSRSTSSDDDADADVSDADAAEPDDESDEDGESDAFAPSDRTIEVHGDQAGHVNGYVSHHESNSDRKSSNGPPASQDKSEIVKASVTVGDSDDDVYNRVDLISDSEEDEPEVEHVEERNIIESEEADGLGTAPAIFEASDGWEGFELDRGLSLEDIPFFDEQYGRTDSNILDSSLELFQSASILDEVPLPSPPLPSPRRVRFKEPLSQLSNDSDMDSDNRDINVLFSPVSTPAVPSGVNLKLSGPCLDHGGEDGSSGGSASGYESGLYDFDLICDANLPPSQLTMATPLKKKMFQLVQLNAHSHFFVSHHSRRWCLRLNVLPRQKQRVLPDFLELLRDIAVAHAWALGQSIPENRVRSSTAPVKT